jgi:hypothetical protein
VGDHKLQLDLDSLSAECRPPNGLSCRWNAGDGMSGTYVAEETWNAGMSEGWRPSQADRYTYITG